MEQNESFLIDKFSNIYIMLLYSIMTNDIKRVKHYLSDELYIKFDNIVKRNISNNETQMYDELNVYKIDIIRNEIINNKNVVTVNLVSRYMDYIIDNNTKKIKRGINTSRITKNNILTFEKNINNNDKKVIYTCPNCCANLDIHFNGVCSYCRTSIDLQNDDFILTCIE